MSESSANVTVTYLAQGKIRVKVSGQPPRTVDSVYGNSIREKAVRTQQKHSWKSAGNDSTPFSGAVLWGKSAMTGDIPLAITSICGGKEPGSLVYSLESGSLCALVGVSQLGAEEQRLWNDNRTQLRHVSMSRETGDLVFSILHENGTANIGVKLAGGVHQRKRHLSPGPRRAKGAPLERKHDRAGVLRALVTGLNRRAHGVRP